MVKPRKIHIEDKIIKWKLHHSPFDRKSKSYIGIWDGKYHKVGLYEFMRYIGEPALDFSELEEYYINHNGNDFIPQLTPSNIKQYYLTKIKIK
jgi:hypothetical protein